MYFRGGILVNRKMEDMDVEWMELILEAIKTGMTKETVRDFLNQKNCLIENN
jgi:hypothetical protein